MGAERRLNQRWTLDALEVIHITSIDQMLLIANSGWLIEASSTGFRLIVEREDLVPREFRGNLTLDPLVGQKVSLEIRTMNLDIMGQVIRTKPLGKGQFEIIVDYTEDAPEYWRECLVDLLPKTDE